MEILDIETIQQTLISNNYAFSWVSFKPVINLMMKNFGFSKNSHSLDETVWSIACEQWKMSLLLKTSFADKTKSVNAACSKACNTVLNKTLGFVKFQREKWAMTNMQIASLLVTLPFEYSATN